VVALGVGACVDTTLDTSRRHPANPSAHPAAPAPPPAALASGFDPFAAYSKDTAPAEPSDPATGGVAVVYTCPMHPEIVRNAPGNCPICGMKLVPKKPSQEPPPKVP
jgi:Cu+-exporting ATPase